MKETLQKIKEIREQIKDLYFKDISLVNYKYEADLALLKIEKKLEERSDINEMG